MTKKFSVVAIATLSLAILASPSAHAQVRLLAGYDFESSSAITPETDETVGPTNNGTLVDDISGWPDPADGYLQIVSSLVPDDTRPGAGAVGATNEVLSTGAIGIGSYSLYKDRFGAATNGFTMTMWLKQPDVSPAANFQSVIGRGSQSHRIFILDGGHANVAISDGNNAPGAFQFADITGAFNDGQWHHVAAVLDTSDALDPRLIGYLDGAEVTNQAACEGTNNYAAGCITGTGTPGGTGAGFDNDPRNGIDLGGRSEDDDNRAPDVFIDEAGYFSGALSPTNIGDLFSGEKSIIDFAVPEPATFGLLGTAMLGLMLRRRRS